jgi:hypothetical protein
MVAVPMLATVMVIVQMLYVEAGAESGSEPHAEGEEGFDPDLDEPLGVVASAGT